jgi:hypothetical protein
VGLGFLADCSAVVVSPKKRAKAQAYAIGAGFFAVLCASPARGQAAHVDNRCPRLSTAAYEELDARILLLLKSEGGQRTLPGVVCTDQGSWVEWDGQRFDIVGRGTIADEVVDIVEAQLHEAGRKADADPKTAEASAVAAGQPMLERGSGSAPAPPAKTQPADRVAVRAVDARGGGISLAIETEMPSATIATSMGPAFDFGASVGPLTLGGREAIRFTVADRRVSFMDFEVAVGYGAPFNPDKVLGVVARFGAEWMVAYPEGNSGQAAVVPVTDLGVRAAYGIGAVTIWFGADAHLRLATLSLRSRERIVANDVGGSFSLGVALVDWSRK